MYVIHFMTSYSATLQAHSPHVAFIWCVSLSLSPFYSACCAVCFYRLSLLSRPLLLHNAHLSSFSTSSTNKKVFLAHQYPQDTHLFQNTGGRHTKTYVIITYIFPTQCFTCTKLVASTNTRLPPAVLTQFLAQQESKWEALNNTSQHPSKSDHY